MDDDRDDDREPAAICEILELEKLQKRKIFDRESKILDYAERTIFVLAVAFSAGMLATYVVVQAEKVDSVMVGIFDEQGQK